MHAGWRGRPKIAGLLARPEAKLAVRELRLARSLGTPPSILRGRVRSTTYLYEDPDHPDRPTGTVESPEWTDDDRALLLALAEYESTLCPGPCGEPIAVAWHTDMDGFYDGQAYHCYACSALLGEDKVYHSVANTRAPDKPLSLFELGVTTFSPEPTP